MKEQVVYVEQYGGVWKITLDEWKAICRAGLTGEGYVLPPCRQLTRRPAWVRRSTDSPRVHYWSADPNKKLVHPLDWSVEAYREELKQLGETVDG